MLRRGNSRGHDHRTKVHGKHIRSDVPGLAYGVLVQVSRTPANDGLAPLSGPASEKRQGTKSREVALRRCGGLYGDWASCV